MGTMQEEITLQETIEEASPIPLLDIPFAEYSLTDGLLLLILLSVIGSILMRSIKEMI